VSTWSPRETKESFGLLLSSWYSQNFCFASQDSLFFPFFVYNFAFNLLCKMDYLYLLKSYLYLSTSEFEPCKIKKKNCRGTILCSTLEVNRRFGITYRLYFHDIMYIELLWASFHKSFQNKYTHLTLLSTFAVYVQRRLVLTDVTHRRKKVEGKVRYTECNRMMN
jgi:hypothetical protein